MLEGVHKSAIEALNREGYSEIIELSGALPEEELIEKIRDVHFVGIRSRTQLTEKVFAAANKLVAVGCFCIGTNQVDTVAAMKTGVAVFNAPFSNTRSVAELVMAEMILLLRGVPEKSAGAHRGDWKKSATGSYEIRGKKLGIVGYGNIGMQLGVMAESLGMQVFFYDVLTKLPLGNAQQIASLEKLMSSCDLISLHVPETQSTHTMIGETELGWIKNGGILINASRGTVVDIDALCAVLESGVLAGAAIDVFPIEPRSNKDEFISPLRGFDNVILTPHIGGSTMEAQANIGEEVAEKLIKYSDNGTSVSSVNFPEVGLPAHPDKHRLLHIHHNVPGVMSEINRVFSEVGVNISGQYLQTNETIGYVVIDIDVAHSDIALDKLRSVEGTIRTRVLF